MNEKIRALIDRLSERTANGSLMWHPGVAKDSFVVNFPSLSVEIMGDRVIRWMRIFDEKGNLIEEIAFTPTPTELQRDHAALEYYDRVHGIHTMARRQALNSDQKLDILLQELA